MVVIGLDNLATLINTADCQAITPLHQACISGNVSAARLLIENGADMNAVDYHGRTPLHHAIRNEHLAVVQLLKEKALCFSSIFN